MKKSSALLPWYLAIACPLFAQSDRGAITGTIGDPTGALIPNAKITLLNASTGFKTATISTATGNYTLSGLPVGKYSLLVESAGFSRYEQTNIEVQVAVTTRVEVALKVGAASESVQVTAEASLLKS
jgi:hypothetical protein